MSRLTRDGTAGPVSRHQIPRHVRGQGNIHFPCSADHEPDWQPYPVDPYSAVCDDYTYIILKPTGIQIATKPLPDSTNREHRKYIGVKNTKSLSTNYSFYSLWSVGLCVVCVVILFILDVRFVDIPAGVTQEEGHSFNFSREKDSAIPFPRGP